MGADIYYNSPKFLEKDMLFEKWARIPNSSEAKKEEAHLLWKKAYNEFDESGDYFRDSYNSSSLLNIIGLSWWRDVIPMLDEEGQLPIIHAMRLWKMIEKSPIVRETIKARMEEVSFGEKEELSDKELDEWYDYFVEKKATFMKMLDRSIENNNPLLCSL